MINSGVEGFWRKNPVGFSRFNRNGSQLINGWLSNDDSFDNDDDKKVGSYEECDRDVSPENTWGRYGEYELVGNGKVTSDKCGTFSRFAGCLNVDRHSVVDLDGRDYSGKVYFEKRFHSCDKPTCPICYKRGWAVDEATRIEKRLEKFSNGYVDKDGKRHTSLGFVEHIVCSVPVSDYGLKYRDLKKKSIKVLSVRGVIGGVIIFHAFRYKNALEAAYSDNLMGWYFSPHWHVLGYIEGGYGCCRGCKRSRVDCWSCSGFEGKSRRFFEGVDGKEGDGYIVKVLEKRKSVHATAWYQLNHASLVRGKKENRVVTWFGVCSYRKLQLTKEDKVKHEKLCPCCGKELERLVYVGDESKNPVDVFWYKSGWVDYLDKDGKPNWIRKPDSPHFATK